MKGLVVVVCVWAILSSCDVGDGADEITLTIDTKSTYTQFLTSLRNNVKGREVYHKIPMMPAPSNPPNFLLVVLKPSDSDNSITVSLDKNDLYVMGYSEMLKDEKGQLQCRYHVFKDKISICDPPGKKGNSLCSLCDGKPDTYVAKAEPINYSSSYKDLEGKAGDGGRRKLGLGINKLKSYMNAVYGKTPVDTKKEAKFLLAAVQMVSEAARFTYIENKIPEELDDVFIPKDMTICLESKWGKLSKAVRQAPAGPNINIEVNCWVGYDLIIKGTTELLKQHIALLSYNVDVANTLLESDDTDEVGIGSVPTLDGGLHAIL